jgi:endoglucanase
MTIREILFLTCLTISTNGMHITNAKNKPKYFADRQTAFRRASGLDKGISISWLEQTWNAGILDTDEIKKTDYALLKKLGFKSIRLPVAFEYFEDRQIPLQKVFSHIDAIVKQCNLYGLKLVIVYHYGNINDNNYVSETQKTINLWQILAKRYQNVSADNLFFEVYNEPPHMDPQRWKDAAYNIVTAIRKIDRERTLLVGASNFNSIYELSRFVRLADENIIYTFHFYEPFFFTHQGAEWIGDQVSTTGVPFPYVRGKNFPPLNPKAKNTPGESHYNEYPKDGNEQSIHDKLQIVKNWANHYGVPIICSEYGVYNKYADLDSRCNYIKAMRRQLKAQNIPGMLWDYNTNFSIFTGTPSLATLPGCMKDAIGYTQTK